MGSRSGVSCVVDWSAGEWRIGRGIQPPPPDDGRFSGRCEAC